MSKASTDQKGFLIVLGFGQYKTLSSPKLILFFYNFAKSYNHIYFVINLGYERQINLAGRNINSLGCFALLFAFLNLYFILQNLSLAFLSLNYIYIWQQYAVYAINFEPHCQHPYLQQLHHKLGAFSMHLMKESGNPPD